MAARHLSMAALLAGQALAVPEATCPGQLGVGGFGSVDVVPAMWLEPDGAPRVDVRQGSGVTTYMGARAYFANACKAGTYNHSQYLAFNLLGKTMRYTANVSGLGCGCNAAFYFTSMRQNAHKSECSDYYCDANDVCGESCAEIDVQEANMFAWHSTLHTMADHSGLGLGYGGGGSGWSGPRDWSASEYGPGAKCIDTKRPFEVAVSFPADAQCQLSGMTVTLTQEGHDCPLSLSISSYAGMAEMSAALRAGMTPIVSYWASEDMLWMDGKGQDGQGPCETDTPADCGGVTSFYGFSVESMAGSACQLPLTDQRPASPPTSKPKPTPKPEVTEREVPHEGAATTPVLPLMALAFAAGIAAGAGGLSLALSWRARAQAQQPSNGAEESVGSGQTPLRGGLGLPAGRTSSSGLLALATGEAQQQV